MRGAEAEGSWNDMSSQRILSLQLVTRIQGGTCAIDRITILCVLLLVVSRRSVRRRCLICG